MKGSSNVFDLLAGMSMYCYDTIINILHDKLNECINGYTTELQKRSPGLNKMEDRLGWLVQLVAALLKAKTISPSGFSKSDAKDVEIYAAILKLIGYTTSLYDQNYFVSLYLELSYIAFCDGFQKEVISTQKRLSCGNDNEFDSTTDAYSTLEQALQVGSFNEIIDMLLHKLYIYKISNLG